MRKTIAAEHEAVVSRNSLRKNRMSQATRNELRQKSDSVLVAATRNGEAEAFDFLVSRHEARVFRVAFRITRNHENARDVVQQSFFKAFMHLDRFHEKSAFSTWLTRIAINEALMWLRKNRGRRETSLEDLGSHSEKVFAAESMNRAEDPEQLYERKEKKRAMFEAINQLSTEFRAALSLRLEERTVGEIAEILSLRVGTLKARLFRARKQVESLLAPAKSARRIRRPGRGGQRLHVASTASRMAGME